MTFAITQESILDALNSDQRMSEMSVAIGRDIASNKYDISSFVESLGFALTSPEVDLRVKGTKCLSLTLGQLPSDYLNSVQLEFVVNFYCDRLKDHHSVIPSIINGLSYLMKMKNLSEGLIPRIVTTFFQHVSCQSQSREDRENIFKLLKFISKTHSGELIGMGPNYIYNIISAIDGERDPRNLVFLFEFMPDFIKQYPLHHLAEEMYETFACYFPVDFHPMKDDPKSISRDTLAEKLSYCLVASDEFIPWTVPLALEKLGSDLVVAKIDSLVLLTRSANKFPPDKIDEYFDEIWSHLKPEILPGSGNSDILREAFSTLDAILRNAASNASTNKNIQTKILSNIIPYVSNSSHHLFAPAFRIANLCVSNNTVFAGEKILGAVALRLKEMENQFDEKTKLLAKASQVLEICAESDTFSLMDATTLEQIQRDLLDCLTVANNELMNLSWRNIECSVGIFSQNQRMELYSKLTHELTGEKCAPNLSSVILKYARKFPKEVSVSVVDTICCNLGKLPVGCKRNVYFNIVHLLSMAQFEQPIINLLTAHIFDSDDNEDVASALIALRKWLDSCPEAELVRKIWSTYNILDRLYKVVETRSLDKESLMHISVIISLFMRQLSVADQQKIVDKYVPMICPKAAGDLYVLHGIIGHLNGKVSIELHFEKLVSSLVTLCLNIEDDVARHIGHWLLCSVVNRMEESLQHNLFIGNTLKTLREEIKKGRKAAVIVLAWISKGLMVRGYEEAGELIDDISELLDHPTLFEAAELAFDIISDEVPELHLPIIKLLYKQKIFHIVLNKLWTKLANYEVNHINAFVHVLGMTPHAVLKMYLEKTGPVIFKCLDSEKPKTVEIALCTVKPFLREQNDYFRSHLSHLIPQLLALSTRKDSMALRISALNCLDIITHYPVYTVQLYKTDVILGLAGSLDDKKRLVRNAAVTTRNAWYLVGTDKSSTNK